MRRFLTPARLLGTTAFALVGLFALDMPDGYLGPADHLTLFGSVYGAVLLALTLVGVVSQLREQTWSSGLIPVLWSMNIGLFVPGIVSDPLVAVLLIVWHLVMLAQHLFPSAMSFGASAQPLARGADRDISEWYATYGPAVRHLVVVSLVLTVAVVGFDLSNSIFVLVLCFALNLGTIAASSKFVWLIFRRRNRGVGAMVLFLIASVVAIGAPGVSLTMLAVYQLLVLMLLVGRGPVFSELLEAFFDYPAILIVIAFASVILLGALFLTFPEASATGVPIDPLDALFTSTSAVCVTGLIVVDTPVAFSTFGHVVIMILIEIGGLGIMVLSTFGTLLVGGKLGLRGERALGEMLELRDPRSAYRLTMFIVLSTLIIEGIGALLLAISYVQHGFGLGEALWRGVFHSISAFCNAGFALQSDSVVMFQNDPFPLMVISSLIVLGGIGFLVLAGAWQTLVRRKRARLSMQAKVVGAMTAFLIVSGALLYLGVEWNHTLKGLGVVDKIFNAIFQSVTLRTAGFNSVDFKDLQGASVLFMIIYMFIGASPGSTGGGIKTTTTAVLFSSVRSIARGEPKVTLFQRRISQDIVYRSIAITIATALVVAGAFFLLLLTENQPFDVLFFEVVSAMGTVGLSLGATAKLTAAGKFIIVFVMFAGRTGPLTLALLLGGGKPSPVEYPRGRIMVG